MVPSRALPGWRVELPRLQGRLILMREVLASDVPALVALLSIADASRFGLEGAITADAVSDLVSRARLQREAGVSYTFVVAAEPSGVTVGLVHVKQLDPMFEGAECDCTLVPSVRGTGIFGEVAELVAAFAFETVGTRRLEARVLVQNGRANSALRKVGATQEGVLRRAVRQDGEYADQALWSFLKDDWVGKTLAGPPRDC